jgi:hypothetical protein
LRKGHQMTAAHQRKKPASCNFPACSRAFERTNGPLRSSRMTVQKPKVAAVTGSAHQAASGLRPY